MPHTFLPRRGPAADWVARNPILREGEMGLELGTSKYKIGDGIRRWVDLPYFTNEDEVQAFVVSQIALLEGRVSGVTVVEFQDHINSEAPHPVYEDGADLTLLYENAKV